jgi:hypothetical protein
MNFPPDNQSRSALQALSELVGWDFFLDETDVSELRLDHDLCFVQFPEAHRCLLLRFLIRFAAYCSVLCIHSPQKRSHAPQLANNGRKLLLSKHVEDFCDWPHCAALHCHQPATPEYTMP